ncbi:TmcC family electron transfer complex membrane anchor subunit [Paucidesulfovibrio longus]|uniref:TmcC family electron transfer complex membrane anchor subunit n=1 Tax=Paucidesulfovibrio longus TaxID=889 RepID=UPI0003B37BEF|nr:Tmc redox complex membrane protein TmcC [Paucidesulfovibrio longus]
MHDIYNFVVGPLAWFGWGVFILGSIFKLVYAYNKFVTKDGTSAPYMSWKYGLRSIGAWLVPFNALGWRNNPLVTVVTFVFHICLILVPVFLSAHAVLWQQFFGVEFFWTLPDNVADYMTLAVIAACVFFAVRRLAYPRVRFVTEAKDWWVLLLVVSPFITGFLAYHQVFQYQIMIVLHVITGLAWLALIPFSRLAHMLFILFSRAYIGSEFGGVRKAKDW